MQRTGIIASSRSQSQSGTRYSTSSWESEALILSMDYRANEESPASGFGAQFSAGRWASITAGQEMILSQLQHAPGAA